jgi:hypothetical protein
MHLLQSCAVVKTAPQQPEILAHRRLQELCRVATGAAFPAVVLALEIAQVRPRRPVSLARQSKYGAIDPPGSLIVALVKAGGIELVQSPSQRDNALDARLAAATATIRDKTQELNGALRGFLDSVCAGQ